MVHYSGYYSKYDLQRLVQDSAYYSKISRVLFSVWFKLFKIRPAASVQRLVPYSGYYSQYDLQGLVKDSGYYPKMSRVQGVLFKIASGSLFRVLFKLRPAAIQEYY